MNPARAAKRDLGGTIRSCSAAESLARARPLFPTLGITRVANVTGLDCIGIPVAICVRPTALHLSVSQGKGLTQELAEISAVMESIELYHAERVRPAELVASYEDVVRQHAAIDPRTLNPGPRFAAYRADRPLRWIAGRDLLTGSPVWVPHVLVCLDCGNPHPDAGLFEGGSNGLASGNSPAEAMCHGLYELIERDAEFFFAGTPPQAQAARRRDLSRVQDDSLATLLSCFARAGVELAVWELGSTLGLPVYRCLLADRDPWRGLSAFHGAGCHLQPRVALCRALTEAAQTRLTLISGSRDDVFPSLYRRQQTMDPVDLAIELAAPAAGLLDACDAPPARWHETFEEDLAEVVQRLAAGGHSQVIAVDLSQPELGIPVVHMVVPGLRFLGARI